MTHPFHPRAECEYVVVAVRSTWGEDRVFFLDEDGIVRSLPAAWTDAAEPDPFVVVAAGRSPFRVDDLLALAGLLDGLGCADAADGV